MVVEQQMNKVENKRVKGVTISVPVVYGTIAFSLGKKAEEGVKTHKWTCYVRGINNEDISYYIKKVIFTLHPSFPNPKRVVERFPFEIHEVGWGEFEIAIKVYFQDASEKPVDLFHTLKLHPPEGQVLPPKKPVVSETYDEIVFNSPKEEFYKVFLENPPGSLPPKPSKYSEYFTQFSEQQELRKILDAQKKVKGDTLKLREKLEKLDAEAKQLKEDISKLESNIYQFDE